VAREVRGCSGFEWENHSTKTGELYLFIKDEPGVNNYYLYYDSSSSPSKKSSRLSLVSYTETISELRIKTGSYEARIPKVNGGEITDFYVSGTNELLYSLDSRVYCNQFYGLSTASNQQFNVTDNGLYIKVTFRGSRFNSESYVIEELFFPDRIIVKDNMKITTNTNCNR
jgi:hypothetical protein